MKIELVNVDKNNVRPAPFWAYKLFSGGKEFPHVVSMRFEINTQDVLPYIEIAHIDEQNQHQITKLSLSSVVFSADTVEVSV